MKKKKKKKKEEGRITWRGGDGWLDEEDDLKLPMETVVELAVGGSCRFCFPFFLSPCCFRFSAPSLCCSFVSVIATVVSHGAGGDDGGRMWLQMVVPGDDFSSFLLCFCFSSVFLCFCFFFCFSWCRGC
jgi:hypothetical protein